MNDLPEINFKEKKEKKKGFLAWLRSRLGFGGRTAMGGAGEALPGAANIGRAAFGAGKFGASAGIGGLLAGKGGLIVTAMVVAAAVGTNLYMKNESGTGVSTSAFSSNKTPDNYVPAILRQNQSQGSSLDLFKDTNKGAMGEESAPKEEAKDTSAAEGTKEDAPAADPNAQAPGANSMQEMMGKIAGGSFGGGLSSSMGGGNKFSGMGGFGNKFNSGATGGKAPGLSNLGSGFQNSPKFDQRKKLLAMANAKRPVVTKSKGVKSSFGKKSYDQAKGLSSLQRSYTGSNIDSLAGTQNAAWTGSTGEGSPAGGGGITPGDAGAGIITSPSSSVDHATGGGNNENPDWSLAQYGEQPITSSDVSPWKGLPEMAMLFIGIAIALALAGNALVLAGYAAIAAVGSGSALILAGRILCALAMAAAAVAIAIGIKIVSMDQPLLGGIYIAGGLAAAAAAGIAAWGGATPGAVAGITTAMAAAAAGVMLVIGAMYQPAPEMKANPQVAASQGGNNPNPAASPYLVKDNKTGNFMTLNPDGTPGPAYSTKEEAIKNAPKDAVDAQQKKVDGLKAEIEKAKGTGKESEVFAAKEKYDAANLELDRMKKGLEDNKKKEEQPASTAKTDGGLLSSLSNLFGLGDKTGSKTTETAGPQKSVAQLETSVGTKRELVTNAETEYIAARAKVEAQEKIVKNAVGTPDDDKRRKEEGNKSQEAGDEYRDMQRMIKNEELKLDALKADLETKRADMETAEIAYSKEQTALNNAKTAEKAQQDKDRELYEYRKENPLMMDNTIAPKVDLSKLPVTETKTLNVDSQYFKSDLPPLTAEQLKALQTNHPAPDYSKPQFIQGHD